MRSRSDPADGCGTTPGWTDGSLPRHFRLSLRLGQAHRGRRPQPPIAYSQLEATHDLPLALALGAPSSHIRLGVRRSRPIRNTQIECSARLTSRLPPRLSRCLTTLPEEASTGETPQKLAKDASLLNLSGLSPAVTSSVAAWSVPTPGKATRPGATLVTSRVSWTSSSAISSESDR